MDQIQTLSPPWAHRFPIGGGFGTLVGICNVLNTKRLARPKPEMPNPEPYTLKRKTTNPNRLANHLGDEPSILHYNVI